MCQQGGSPVSSMKETLRYTHQCIMGGFFCLFFFKHCIKTFGCFHTYLKVNMSTVDRQARMRWPDELDGGCNEVWARCGVMPCGDATWVNGQQITDIDAAVQKTTTEYTAFQKERTRQGRSRKEERGDKTTSCFLHGPWESSCEVVGFRGLNLGAADKSKTRRSPCLYL